jgi:glycogen synthase
MRVLYWAELFRPDIGGVEVVSVPLIHGLQKRGHEIAAVATHGRTALPDHTDFDGIPIYRFRFHKALLGRDPRMIRSVIDQVAALKRSFQPNLIHINTSQPSLFFHQQTITAHLCPTLVSVYEPVIPTETNSLLGRTLQQADWITAMSDSLLTDIRQFMPEVSDKSSLIRSELDMPTLAPSPLNWQPQSILCFGRLVHEKGFDVALRAFAQVRGHYPDLRLRIAGDGPIRRDLEALANSLNIAQAVDFMGWVEPENIPALINEATLVVMPSRWQEPFGYVALQTAQMARPIVATRVGGIPEIVIDGQTGILVDPESSDQLADALLRLLGNPSLAETIGQAARHRAETCFSFSRVVDQYAELYTTIGQRSGQQSGASSA